MNSIQAHAHILTDEGIDAKGVAASLETYVLNSRRWIKLATVKTNAKGIWTATITRLQSGAFYSPMLRLSEAGSPPNRILAHGGFVSYNSTKKVLTVDFGTIERLEEVAYPLKPSNSSFNRSKLTIAGQAKKSKISIVSILRNNPTITAGTIGAIPTATMGGAGATISGAEAAAIKRNPLLDNFDAEILKFTAKEADLQSKITLKDNLLATKNIELQKSKLEINTLQQQLQQRILSEKTLKEQNKTFIDEAKRKTSIQDIAANIGSEVDNANKKLKQSKRPYRFGRIELDLRGTVSSDGQKMALASLVDLKDISNSAVLPGIKFEILPDSEPTVISGVTVPEVTGLTETAVRRLLQAVGLRLERIDKSIEDNTDIPIGQSIQQSPKTGTKLQRGEAVLVVFTAPVTHIDKG